MLICVCGWEATVAHSLVQDFVTKYELEVDDFTGTEASCLCPTCGAFVYSDSDPHFRQNTWIEREDPSILPGLGTVIAPMETRTPEIDLPSVGVRLRASRDASGVILLTVDRGAMDDPFDDPFCGVPPNLRPKRVDVQTDKISLDNNFGKGWFQSGVPTEIQLEEMQRESDAEMFAMIDVDDMVGDLPESARFARELDWRDLI